MNYIQDNIWWLVIGLNYLFVFITAGYEIMHNREPAKTISLLFALVVLPVIGLIIYYFFAQEFRKDKIFNRKKVYDHEMIKKWEEKLILIEKDLEHLENFFVDDKIKLVRLLQNNQTKPFTFGNKVDILVNGRKKFETLFTDLKKAEKHIHLEYYIFRSDYIGNKLIDILCEKAEEGVEIRISYDYVGSSLSSKALKRMNSCGIEIFPFMPVWFPNLTRKLNYRDHRKIVIIDGKIGFIGGVNISDEYVNYEGQEETKMYWRDTHLRIEGHGVKSIQAQFLLNFNFITSKEIEIKDEYFPSLEPAGKSAVQIAASGPDTDWRNIMEAILTAINTAEKYVYITTPYFIPNNEILTALCTASRIGIDIKIIIPEIGDSVVARHATNSYIEMLLESGVRVFHYCKGMVHAKTMVVDGMVSTVGTSNLDNRSFDINFEINAFVYDKYIAQEMLVIFNNDLLECDELDLEDWRNRPYTERIKESLSRLWAPLL
ncbi:MAG TPA: cardiolipin synthase [Salegentibacter sp.]|nr:cardiolipin synthase [Salegentibacter sp.]